MRELRVDNEILLRELAPEHAETLFALVDANRAHLRRWLPWLDGNTSVKDSLAFIETVAQQRLVNGEFVAGIWFRNELVGVVGHNRLNWDDRSGYLGYWLAQNCEGRGVMTRCCRALIDQAFTKLEMERVWIRCAPENRKSRAIPERLGFQPQSTDQAAEWLYDHFVDLINYQIRREDWRG